MMQMQTSTLRYRLPQKAIKSDCPECGPKHRRTLSRYVDTRTNEPLPAVYGRCDRESNCGYHLSPYHKSPSGMSYSDELYQASRQNDPVSHSFAQRISRSQPVDTPEVKIVPDKPIQAIPDEVVNKSLCRYEQNQFARLLTQHHGEAVARQLLSTFRIGSSKCWGNAGACVFWLIDEKGRVRGGQVKLFDETFHTVKYMDRDGRKRTRTSWAHAVLSYQLNKAEQPQPDWLTAYIEQADFAPCLFGLPQLQNALLDKPIAIVEAPKTAVLCTPYFTQFIWMAVVGRSYLNAERLAPLRGRHIVLFPDLSTDSKDYQYWKNKADNLRQQGFSISVSDYLEKLATEDDRAKGMDLADFLLGASAHTRPYMILASGEKILGELLGVGPCDTYPADWDTPVTKPFVPPPTRIAHPRAPLAFDAAEQLRRIRWAVMLIDQPDEPAEEANSIPTLTTSPNRDAYAQIIGIPSQELPLYQLKTYYL